MKVIYIIGAGRSGTTLLDILLGNQKGVFSAGELNRFLVRDGVPHAARDQEVMKFWDCIRKKVKGHSALVNSYANKLEYHLGWFTRLLLSKKSYQAYSEFNIKLFSAIDEHSEGCEFIVDSSKYPMRAKYLAETIDDIRFIYIQRNPLDVIASFLKKDVEQPSKGVVSANVYLLVVNVLATIVVSGLKRRKRVSVISYDEMVTRPKEVFEKISKDLDLNLTDVQSRLERGDSFKVGKLFDGNRLRLQDEVKLKLRNRQEIRSRSAFNSIFLPVHKFCWYKF